MGRGESEGCYLRSRPAWFYLTSSPPHPTSHDRENFLAPSPPLGAPPHLVKLYYLLICPQLLQLFLIKLISLIKIYLKLQINLSHQIKLIFSKKLNNIIKMFNKKISPKKNLKIQNQ